MITSTDLNQKDEDSIVAEEADDIATKITKFLIEGFKTKMSRDPTNEEIEQVNLFNPYLFSVKIFLISV